MRVVWTEHALSCLQDIEDYIARHSAANAVRFIDRLIDRARALSMQPALGRPFAALPDSGLRELTEGNYRIIYWIRREQVEILSVFEGHYTQEVQMLKEQLGTEASEGPEVT